MLQRNEIPKDYSDELNLSFKNINDLTGLQDIKYLNKIKVLNLRDNELTTLPENIFSGLTNLEILIITGNKLQTMPAGIFTGLNKLRWLYLNSNRLQTLPAGIFAGLDELWLLDLSSNKLQTLPVGIFDGLTSLVELKLNENQLTTLPIGIFKDPYSLLLLDLTNNPLSSESGILPKKYNAQTLFDLLKQLNPPAQKPKPEPTPPPSRPAPKRKPQPTPPPVSPRPTSFDKATSITELQMVADSIKTPSENNFKVPTTILTTCSYFNLLDTQDLASLENAINIFNTKMGVTKQRSKITLHELLLKAIENSRPQRRR